MSVLVFTIPTALAWAGPLLPAGQGPATGRYALASWGTLDGLPQVSITDLAQHPDGYLYVTTFGGVARFDGVRFEILDPTRHEMPTIRFTGVEIAADGRVWLGSQYGHVAFVDGDTTRWLPDAEGLYGIDDLYAEGDALWVGGGGALFRYADGQWTRRPWQTSQIVGGEGGIWAAGNEGLMWIEGDRTTTVSDGLPTPLGGICPDGDGNLWVAGGAGLAVRRADGAILPLDLPSTGPLEGPHPIVDRNGQLWLGHGAGLELLGPAEEVLRSAEEGRPVEPRARWPGLEIRALYVDREGHLWVGTNADGLLRVDEMRFEQIPSPSPSRPSTLVLERYQDGVLVAPRCDGVYAITGSEPAPTARWFDGECVGSLLATRAGMLVGLGPRLFPLERPEQTLVELPRDIRSLAGDPDGVLWLGTDGDGAHRLEGGALTRVEAVPADASVAVIAPAPDGAVWFGTGDGVVIAGPGARARRLGTEQGLPSAEVRAVLLDGDDAWLGTYGGGLVHLAGVSRDLPAVTTLSEHEGLPDATVSALRFSPDGALWGNGNRGLFRLTREELARAGDEHERLGLRLPSPEGNGGNTPASATDASGRVWFPTVDGLVRIDPSEAARNEVAPVPIIEEISVDGRQFPAAGGWTAPPGSRDVLVRFTAAVLGQPSRARFRYRMRPLQDAWIEVGQREVRYAHLPPGKYTLEVLAANEDGVWSAAPAAAVLALAPRLHETLAFRATAVLALAALTLSTIQWQRRRNRILRAEIEQRVQIEEELQRSVDRYRLLFQSASDGLLVTDPDGVVQSANPAAEKMFGGGELTGKRASALVQRDSEQRVRGTRPDGTSFPAQVATAALTDGRVLWSVADLTRAVELSERLAQSRRLEALGRLAGRVAHEFDDLLAATQASTVSLRALPGEDPERSALLDRIEAASKRGTDLTAQLLAFGQQQRLAPRPTDLGELVRRAEPLMRRLVRDPAMLTVRIDSSAIVQIDPGQAEVALVNLVLRAVGASDSRRIGAATGWAEVAVERVEGSEAKRRWPGLPTFPDRAVLSVAGDHPDLDADSGEVRRFEPLAGSTGLDLAAVHGFAAQSSGHVYTRRLPHGGKAFEMVFPVSDAPSPSPRPQRVVRSDHEPPRVLVCDDEPMVRRTIERLLRKGGFLVRTADGGQAALELLDKEPVDLLLTDVMMPGMSGIELARAARERRPGLPVVFVSAYTRELGESGLDAPLISKPFEPATLLSAVSAALE